MTRGMDRVKSKTFLRQTSTTMENNTELCCTGLLLPVGFLQDPVTKTLALCFHNVVLFSVLLEGNPNRLRIWQMFVAVFCLVTIT